MTHLVTGATGYVGRVLVRHLLESGDSVCVLIRGDEASAQRRVSELFPGYRSRYGDRFIVLAGDVTLPSLGIQPLAGLGQGNLNVWHAAANLSFREDDRALVMRTNVDGTRNVVNFANQHASRLYHVSTAFVCGDAKPVFREDDLDVGQGFHNWYESSKFLAEKLVREECDTEYVVFRPSVVVGEASEHKASVCTFGYYRFAFMLYYLKRLIVESLLYGPGPVRQALRVMNTRYDRGTDILWAPWLMLPYPRDSVVDLVHIDDVVNAMIESHRMGVPSGSTLHLTQPEPSSFQHLLESFLSDAGVAGVRRFGLPPSAFRLLFAALHRLLFPYRHYLASILNYMPYISRDRTFSVSNSSTYPGLVPGPLTRPRLEELNRHAVGVVFPRIDWELYTSRDGGEGLVDKGRYSRPARLNSDSTGAGPRGRKLIATKRAAGGIDDQR